MAWRLGFSPAITVQLQSVGNDWSRAAGRIRARIPIASSARFAPAIPDSLLILTVTDPSWCRVTANARGVAVVALSTRTVARSPPPTRRCRERSVRADSPPIDQGDEPRRRPRRARSPGMTTDDHRSSSCRVCSFSEPGSRPEQPDAHGARRRLQHGCGLLGREPCDVDKFDHDPVALRQLRASLEQPLRCDVASSVVSGRICRYGGRGSEVRNG
jgi:hypothetical protein